MGDVKDVLLLDVTPLSLGIETLGGVFTRLIDRNTTIPTRKSQVFSTAEDGQTAVTIRVFQGEREMAADNKLLGQFDLVGIPPAPRGMPQIEVTLILTPTASLTFPPKIKRPTKNRLSVFRPPAVCLMPILKNGQRRRSECRSRQEEKELIEAKNQAESLIHTTEKTLKENADKVSSADKEAIESAITALKGVIEGDDAAAIKENQTLSCRLP